jgi:hypothetical protein
MAYRLLMFGQIHGMGVSGPVQGGVWLERLQGLGIMEILLQRLGVLAIELGKLSHEGQDIVPTKSRGILSEHIHPIEELLFVAIQLQVGTISLEIASQYAVLELPMDKRLVSH